ncbi:MAG: hypothetical protein ACMXYE_02015 [Candidatus Woesearchaeota archaeon]
MSLDNHHEKRLGVVHSRDHKHTYVHVHHHHVREHPHTKHVVRGNHTHYLLPARLRHHHHEIQPGDVVSYNIVKRDSRWVWCIYKLLPLLAVFLGILTAILISADIPGLIALVILFLALGINIRLILRRHTHLFSDILVHIEKHDGPHEGFTKKSQKGSTKKRASKEKLKKSHTKKKTSKRASPKKKTTSRKRTSTKKKTSVKSRSKSTSRRKV